MVLSSIFSKGVGQKGGGDITTLLIKNSGFLAKIFTNLLVQLAITYYVMENYPVRKTIGFISLVPLVYCWLLHGQICLIGLNFLCLFCFRMYWADFLLCIRRNTAKTSFVTAF